MTKLRIDPSGVVRGLWTDAVEWRSLGTLSVERASHVEFEAASQCWIVIAARARSGLREEGGEAGFEVLFRSPRRSAALEWEQNYFGPGGPGWRDLIPKEKTSP